jgi:hypothetical protein
MAAWVKDYIKAGHSKINEVVLPCSTEGGKQAY